MQLDYFTSNQLFCLSPTYINEGLLHCTVCHLFDQTLEVMDSPEHFKLWEVDGILYEDCEIDGFHQWWLPVRNREHG